MRCPLHSVHLVKLVRSQVSPPAWGRLLRSLQHRLRLHTHGITDAMDMLGERSGWQLDGHEEAHVVALVTGHPLAASDVADEADHVLIPAWPPAVDPSSRNALIATKVSSRFLRITPSHGVSPSALPQSGWHHESKSVRCTNKIHTPRAVEDGGNDADPHAHAGLLRRL